LVAAVLVVLVPFVKEHNAQTAARYALSAAIWDQQTVRLDDYEHTLLVDRVDRDGHVYSDKAPLQPFLAAPIYGIARAAGAEPATVLRPAGNLGLWWVTLWSSLLPAAVLVVLLYRHARRWFPSTAGLAALTMLFATLFLPFAVDLHGHVMAATLAFAAWHVSSGAERPTFWRGLGFGVLLAAAVATEYPLAAIAIVLMVELASRRAWAAVAAACAAGVPFVAFLLWYQNLAFGSPFRTSYAQKFSDPESAGVGFDRLPNPVHLFQIFFGLRGLIFTPLILFALYYAVQLIRTRAPARREAIVALAVFVPLLILQSSWPNPWGGEMPGPRYLIPALPFLIVPLAAAWRARPLAIGVAVGVVAMGLPVLTSSLTAVNGGNIVGHIQNLQDYGFTPTLFSMAIGPVGWVFHVAAAGVVVWGVTRAVLDERRVEEQALTPADVG
jgi:hypothetical protein